MTLGALPVRTITLILANAALLATLASVALRGTQAASLLATPPRSYSISEVPLVSLNNRTNLNLLDEATLLYATRHVYVAPSADNQSLPKPDYRVTGTFAMPGKPAIALLTSAGGASRKVTVGDSLEGWSVEAIEGGRVVLRHGEETSQISSATREKPSTARASLVSAPSEASVSVTGEPGVRVLGQSGAPSITTRTAQAEPKLQPRLYQAPRK